MKRKRKSKEGQEDITVKTTLTFEQLMQKALSTAVPQADKKKKKK